nr:uncharacterized protein LOC111429042 [Onthophagus taurus]
MSKGCAISGCIQRYGSFYRFPNPQMYPEMYQRWVLCCGREDLLQYEQLRVYNNFRVCEKHFRREDVGRNNKLLKGVVPSLNLPGYQYLEVSTSKASNNTPTTPHADIGVQIASTSTSAISLETPGKKLCVL